MSIYAIGDVQGCLKELKMLLATLQFDQTKDTLWFCGDLINRGPDSLPVLRFVKSLDQRAITVLGNHDLHLIACYYGYAKQTASDTLAEILNAPDCEELIEWLCNQPFLHHDATLNFTLIHAGLPPQWDLTLAKQCASLVETVLRDPTKRLDYFQALYGNFPNHWDETNENPMDKLRFITNCFTRLRFCDADSRLLLKSKTDITHAPPGHIAWFQMPNRASKDLNILFGHWASLYNDWKMILPIPGIYPLDSGCVWGNALSAIRLDDGKRFQVPALKKY